MHEKLLIENFICKERQERYLNLIQTKKGRSKLRNYIAHFKDLNTHFLTEANHIKTPQELYAFLKAKGANDICYIISENSNYDGRLSGLQEAIILLFNSGISYFLSCSPGKLAYYEGEEVNQRFLLKKND